jgi:hypothetical protein
MKMNEEAAALPVSLIIVSDYLSVDGPEELVRSLRAYARDPAGVPDEIVVMLPEGHTFEVEQALGASAPPVIVIRTLASDDSSRLRDAGLAHCRHALVAVVEADCLPRPGWLRTLFDVMREDATIEVMSGRTSYGNETMMKRVMTLLDRGFIEQRDGQGRIVHASNNGALYRREVLEKYKFRIGEGAFVAAHQRQHAMVRDGVRMELDPDAVSIHAYEGWRFIWDVRLNKGFQYARMEMAKASSRRPGPALALRVAWISFKDNRRTIRTVGRSCRWTDRPLLWCMMLVVRAPEFLGALAAGDPARFAASTRYH